MLNRRAFLQRFGIGVASALALASLPTEAIAALTTEQAAKRCACEYLRKVYNEWCATHRGQWPHAFRVSEGLYAAYEGELVACERFMAGDPAFGLSTLMFKGVRVEPVKRLSGWTVEVEAGKPARMECHVS